MAEDGMMRASDADRDAVVSVLRDAYASGRLTLEEFHERTSAAYAGRTWGDLRKLVSDLPDRPRLAVDPPEPGDPERPGDREVSPEHGVSPKPGADPAFDPPGPIRRRPGGVVMPFVVVWFLVMLAIRSPGAIGALAVVLALLVLFTGMSRRK
ncbi:MAG: DUF1707 domain-containing protein [Nocardiopsaceae bacterium]|nr:DUF1707 domain-containing protein [Nocardiopsaceae bacterium]